MNWIDFLLHVPLIKATTHVYLNNLETLSNWETREAVHDKSTISLRFNNVYRPKYDLDLGSRAPHFIGLNKPVGVYRSGSNVSFRGGFKLTWRNAGEKPSYIATSGFILNMHSEELLPRSIEANHIFIGGGIKQPRPLSIYIQQFSWNLLEEEFPRWKSFDATFPGINGRCLKLADFNGPFDPMDDRFFVNSVDHMVFLSHFEAMHQDSHVT